MGVEARQAARGPNGWAGWTNETGDMKVCQCKFNLTERGKWETKQTEMNELSEQPALGWAVPTISRCSRSSWSSFPARYFLPLILLLACVLLVRISSPKAVTNLTCWFAASEGTACDSIVRSSLLDSGA